MNPKRSILLVEDDHVDAMTVKRAFNDLNITNCLEITGNGEEALVHLRDPDKDMPAIILIDLNMPRMNGLELLKQVKNDAVLRRIPVVVMTTSKRDQDKVNSFDLGAAGYMPKPMNYKKFVNVIKVIRQYWSTSELPPLMELKK